MNPKYAALLPLLIAVAPIASAPTSARAELIVYDPTNTAQNVLQAARALEQVNNQIKQLENEVRMLKSLDLQLAPEVTQSIQSARTLFGQAQAIRYNLGTIASEVQTLYPEDYKALGIKEMLQKSDVWVGQSRDSLKRLVEQQARAADGLSQTQDRTDRALGASAKADGQTSAVQASNQMSAFFPNSWLKCRRCRSPNRAL